ncbi:MAG: ATPase [Candidatus Nealsonbacteria bacterium CG08_land_8_20_14_0_20_38_20]|uniref:ATPase n=1 Tax=Candidatus Nealsonbacteria bacterium CG08_land_8_20_14_0_20_38_20 TaxID=1974705 RepID=A0A2H0YLJ5_9BACT|nr:MAG: ATPase [Candidatus Nealsonbacteria bacterium CG08_land_8_20_14_0_20_38_20]
MEHKIIKRTIFSQIASHINEPEMTMILGPRQTGKTTLLAQLKNYLLENKISQEKNILIFNLDFISDLELFKSQAEFFNYLKARTGKEKLYVFVDEAQRVENAGVFFKGIYDKKLPVKFVLTGSSSFELKANLSEPLTGRKMIFTVYPFNFYEYLLSKDEHLAELLNLEDISNYDKKSLLNNLYGFMNYGGYPRVALEENEEKKRQLLKEIYSSYIEKDIIGLLRIKNFSGYAKLMKIIAEQIGGLANYHELSQTAGLSFRTIESYLEILEQTFVIERITPFFKNIRKELSKMPKIYFIDPGLRNSSINSFKSLEIREDRGALLENYVFSALTKKKKENLHFWRTKDKSEVDFIIENSEEIIPLEVKAVSLLKPEITRGMRNFISRYNLPQAFFINLSYRGERMVGKTKVNFILPYEIERIF